MSAPLKTKLLHLNPANIASAFLYSVFGGQERGTLALFTKPQNRSHFVQLDSNGWQQATALKAMDLRERANVYFSIGVQGARPEKGRGKEAGVAWLPGFWGDVDILGANHAATDLPPTADDAVKIIYTVPFKPTVVVWTGGGLQPYWLFREPWELTDDKERTKAKDLSVAFQKYLQNIALSHGWTMDGTPDLCRLLRVPGTFNRKQAEPVLVRYEVVEDGHRYNPSDFADFLDLRADPKLKGGGQGPAPAEPTADFEGVLAGCGWIQHCKNDAATLREPEWYRMLGILACCKNGSTLAHELSKPHPKYTQRETTAKLKHAATASGPTTCDYVAANLGGSEYCARCNHRERITSPVVLGIQRASEAPAPEPPAPQVEAEATADSALPPADNSPLQLPRLRNGSICRTARPC